MNFKLVLLICLLAPILITAQTDTSRIVKENEIKTEKGDTVKIKKPGLLRLPPRILIIKLKDLEKINGVDKNLFTVIDSTGKYSGDELASGLSDKELENYNKNKETLKKLHNQTRSDEDEYPVLTKSRKFLDIAKKAGAVIILILSLL